MLAYKSWHIFIIYDIFFTFIQGCDSKNQYTSLTKDYICIKYILRLE